ncbi:hypothetical protein [Candidatus Odyssella thessalonicensis]|nr:hypothetical protein [Candidatus Odyssella thessalonicensis]
MRRYFVHLGVIIVIKVMIVTWMAQCLFPKENRIKVNTSLIQHKLMD